MKKFYITTSILYASAIPHIGNIYEIILADAISRFKKLDGFDVYFQTGTDEHGQKIKNAATKNNLSPKVYVDYIQKEIEKLFRLVNIDYDNFFRTTNPDHEKAVQTIFKLLLEKGDIYLGKYEGYYSLAEEAFVLEKDLIDGKTKLGDEPIWTSEEAYFFKFSKYQQKLIDYINKNPEFIMPEIRRNEILSFLKEPLADISITRTAFDWGIKIPSDPKHIVYVWIDALLNYITGVGFPFKNDEFKKIWPADLHLIGKDILRFHAIFWPIMLFALDLELPKTIFAHPWILIDKRKMSKSKANIIYADFLVEEFGVDPVRYYCLSEIPYAQDGNLTYELLIERSNSDLTNTIGNLLNRSIGMFNKYKIVSLSKKDIILDCNISKNLRDKALNTIISTRNLIEKFNVSSALNEILELARFANKYIDDTKPWELFKNNDLKKLKNVLYHLFETLRFLSVLLSPFIPETAEKIKSQINFYSKDFKSLNEFGIYNGKPNEASIIFTRYDEKEKLESILNKLELRKKSIN